MRFEAPLTIAKVLERMHRKELVLPAIQREFVWKSTQIEALFDSLMRDYPIGSFLLWDVKPENADKYAYFDFVTHFHQRDQHNAPAKITPGHGVIAVLDGQQRLTAFNIALMGSYAEKLPGKPPTDPNAYPKKRLYLDLLACDHDAGADGLMYAFKFLTDARVSALNTPDWHWFPVSEALKMKPGPDVHKLLASHGLAANTEAFNTLFELINVLQTHETVNFYLEQSDQLDKVLNIFIRVNSGGTTLSYSDLLLSAATAKWQQRDAWEAVHDLVDRMNYVGQGFAFDHDRVLKASLLLTDLADIKFKVDNFTLDAMLRIENNWDEIDNALMVAVKLLAEFGLSGETLTAENAILPVAYYVRHRKLDDSFVTAPRHNQDRERIRSWVLRSMLRGGFWTGAVDTILLKTREVIKKAGEFGFPQAEIEQALAAYGKSLVFDDAEIEDLLYTKYGHRNVFVLLTLLYPGVDVSKTFHQDHVFPKSLFTPSGLADAGVPAGELADWAAWADWLPNLQLLEGLKNQAKSAMLPSDWIATKVPPAQREHYVEFYDLDPLPTDLLGFADFWDRRYDAMEDRLRKLLA